MIIYPAIDLKDGKCVRLRQGDMGTATVYGEDPAAIAQSFEAKGAECLHVVDLDGAYTGNSRNLNALKLIVKSTGIGVQFGGGLRSIKQLDKVWDMGIFRMILGTAALEDEAFLKEAIMRFGFRVAVGIDAKDGKVAVRGWVETSDISPLEFAMKVRDMGVMTIIYTDISRDGMLSGPNFEATEILIRKTGLEIIVSGGVASLEHVKKAREIGAAGVIIGKALYTGAVSLEDAIAEGRKKC